MAAVLPATPYTPRRRSFGLRSSARFFYLVDAIGRLSEPTATQLASLDSSYRSTGEYLDPETLVEVDTLARHDPLSEFDDSVPDVIID
jgi:hypothetical protein